MTSSAAMTSSAKDTLEALHELLSTVLSGEQSGEDLFHHVRRASDAELVALLQTAGAVLRQAEAVVVAVTDTVQERSAGDRDQRLTSRYGCRNVKELIERTTLVDGRTASAFVKAATVTHREMSLVGEVLPAPFPLLTAALGAGAIGLPGVLAATAPLLAAGDRIGTADRLRADAELATAATGRAAEVDDRVGGDCEIESGADDGAQCDPAVSAEDLGVLARVIVSYLDPDGAEPVERAALRKRGISLGVARDGLVPIRGDVLPEVAGQLLRISDALNNPKVDQRPDDGVRFLPDLGPADGSGSGDTPADVRTRSQKLHDTLATALNVAARAGELPTIGGAAPTLVVTVRAEDYAAGAGWAHIDGVSEPVSSALARQIGCCSNIQRVVFDDEGRIVALGTSDRVFNARQRRAIVARDRECIIPGCHVPAAWCEIHHITGHAVGGPTHTDNGALLCWHHHRTLEHSGWQIRARDGLPEVRGPAWWDPHRVWRPTRARVFDRLRH